MSFTESNMLDLGLKAPDFKLPDTVSGATLALKDVQGEKGTMVMFLCNHCPYVIHVNPEIVRIVEDYKQQGIGFVGISSNDVENYPQ
ncbi:MAG: redoxin domain-containing protein, partial [Phaeodactylibacter sp.]|nr:redoxin domain-containing protein [Phaeodactylibacter sp.]